MASDTGVPRIVPIVVAISLAIGVFFGLYLGLGIPHEPRDEGLSSQATSDAAPTSDANTFPDATVDATPDATPHASGTDAASPTQAGSQAVLTITTRPVDAEIQINGAPANPRNELALPIDGRALELEVTASAPGYRSGTRKLAISGDTTLSLELTKRETAPASKPARPKAPRPKSPRPGATPREDLL